MGKAFDIGLGQLAGAHVAAGPRVCEQPQDPSRPAAGTFYLETFGCQMNEHDSEKVAGVLLARGYRQVESIDGADVIL
jgi:hypothetical protein